MNPFRPAADASGDGLLGGGLLLPDALRSGLDAVCGLERLDPFGQFGNAWQWFAPWLRSLAGKPGLELVTKDGQLGEIIVVEEGGAQPRLVVSELGLGNGKVLPNAVAIGAAAASQSFQGVQDGLTRGPWCSRESADCRMTAPSKYTSGGNCC